MNLLFGRNKPQKPQSPARDPSVEELPKEERTKIALDFADFRPKIVPSLLRPLKSGENTRVNFDFGEMARRITSGKPTVKVSEIYQVRPDLFARAPAEGEDVELLFPWGKVWHQLGGRKGLSEMVFDRQTLSEERDVVPEPEVSPALTDEMARAIERIVASAAGMAGDGKEGREGESPRLETAEGGSSGDSLETRYSKLQQQFQRLSRERSLLFAELSELRAGIDAERTELRRLISAAEDRCRQANERVEAYAKAVELRDRELAAAREELARMKAAG